MTSDNTHIIEARHLRREFGDLVAVKDVSLDVHRGEIFGVLGPNGSGKSTTMRMLCGILTPTSGSGRVLGFDIVAEAESIKQHLGYMTQAFSLYQDLTVSENLWFYGGVHGFARAERKVRRERAIERAGLDKIRDQIVGTLSGGWKQRVALACATVHNPPLLFLDEPTAGIDPVSRRTFWYVVHRLAEEGTTVLMTTHYMDEAERCHRLAFIFGGEVFAIGTPQEILSQTHLDVIEIDLGDDITRAVDALHVDTRIDEIAPYGDTLRVACNEPNADEIVREILETAGVTPQAMRPVRTTIEDAFITLVHSRRADRNGALDGGPA